MPSTILDRVRATIERYSMLANIHCIGVGVSGGADSICLLNVLADLSPILNIRIVILHLNHMLRGAEAAADAAFVRDLAAKMGLLVIVGETDVARLAAETGDNLEQAARRARYDFFGRFLASGEVERIALGHTRSDQAETVLFRFLRGAGTAGLAGIRPVTENGFVRPLLYVDRSEVEAYLRDRGIPWREDSSNQVRDFARNRIRHDLLPALTRDWNPALTETMARTADWAQAEEAWWEGEIDRIAARILVSRAPAILLRVEDLHALPLAVARRLLRHAINQVKGDLRSIGFEHIETILNLACSREGSGRTQVPGVDAYRSFDWLRLAAPDLDTPENRNFRLPLTVPGRVEPPGSRNVIFLDVIAAPDYSYTKDVDSLDWDRVSGSLDLRNWRPGDQYHPVERRSPEKIKTLFQEARIPLWERRSWPVIVRVETTGEAIIWSRQFGAAREYAAQPGSRSILRIREEIARL